MILKGNVIVGILSVRRNGVDETIFGIVHLFSSNGRTFKGSIYEADRSRPYLSDDFIYDKQNSILKGECSEVRLLNVEDTPFDMDGEMKLRKRQEEAKIKDGLVAPLMKIIVRDYKDVNVKLVGREYKTDKGTLDFLFSSGHVLYAVEVKVGEIIIEDIRQMEGYVSYFEEKMLGKEVIGILIGKKDYPKKKQEYQFYSISELTA